MSLADDKAPTQILANFQLQDIQNGTKVMTLNSVEGRIYEQEHRTDLEKPVVVFYKANKIASTLTAPKGQIQMETHDMSAWGGVTVVSQDSSTLTTERLRYDAKLQKMLSEDPVHLEKPDSITDGIGMTATPDLRNINIGHEKVVMKNAAKR